MGQAIRHPAPLAFIPASHAPPRGGSLRSGIQTALFAALLVSGLALWLWPQDAIVVLAHLVGGLVLLVLLVPWLVRHLPVGLAHSQRRGFTLLSWALLAAFVAVLATGAAMSVPVLAWIAGLVWFWPREVTELLSLLHLWGSWAAGIGFVLHLGLRHWAWGQP